MGKNKCKCECCCCDQPMRYDQAIDIVERIAFNKALDNCIALPDDVFEAFYHGTRREYRFQNPNVPVTNMTYKSQSVIRASDRAAWKAKNGFTR